MQKFSTLKQHIKRNWPALILIPVASGLAQLVKGRYGLAVIFSVASWASYFLFAISGFFESFWGFIVWLCIFAVIQVLAFLEALTSKRSFLNWQKAIPFCILFGMTFSFLIHGYIGLEARKYFEMHGVPEAVGETLKPGDVVMVQKNTPITQGYVVVRRKDKGADHAAILSPET